MAGLSTSDELYLPGPELWGATSGLSAGAGISPTPPLSSGITTDSGVQITTDSGQSIETSN